VHLKERSAVVTGVLLALLLTGGPTAQAQLPEPGPERYAVSIGVSAVFPTGALADQDPLGNAYYATSGTALRQRFSVALWKRIGLFADVSFPTFGVDVQSIQRDFGSDPPVVDGKNDITSWSGGVRWRGGGSWLRGLYVEASLGWYRQQLELEQEGSDPQQDTYQWMLGGETAAGLVLPLGSAFALDVAATFTQYREQVQRSDVTGRWTEEWTNRWWGLRILAVLTFGGDG
jgi:hypothetical protein